ncbi:MAG: hypothetical protein ABI591_33985 [Kofleriaceae bacterium]
MRWVALGIVLAGCLHGKSHPCTGDDGTSWVCPDDKVCAAAPIYCGTADEVGACDGKMERDPCATMLVPDGQCIADQCTACSNDLAGCRYVGWNPMTNPSAELLNTVVFSGFGEAYAAGDHGTMLRYDTTGWVADPRFPTAGLATKSLVAMLAVGTKVYALTNSNAVYVLDGGAWTALPVLATTYKGMWVAATGEIFLGGVAGRLAKFDGTTWTETTFGGATASYSAMWGTSATDVYAAGNLGAASTIIHFNGTTWAAVTTLPDVGALDAIWGVGSEVFAAGTGIVHATDGSTFATATAPAITGRGIWGSSVTDVFVVGDTGAIVHWDGVQWIKMKVSFASKLQAVAGSSAAEVFAVGDGGAIERYTGAGWAESLMVSSASQLRDLWVAAPDDVYAVGNTGSSTIFHYRAGAWTPETTTGIPGTLTGVWGRSATDVFAVGQLAAAHRTSTWATISSPAIGEAVAVWGDASTVYAVGSQVVSYDGATWTSITNTDAVYTGVWVAPSGKVWLSTTVGIGHLTGTTVAQDVPQGRYNAIWGASETDVFAVGIGTIEHGDGAGFAPMTIPTTATLSGVWGRAADDVFAVGVGSTVLHLHAGIWKQFTTPFSADLAAVSGSGSSIYTVASDGSMYLLLDTAP